MSFAKLAAAAAALVIVLHSPVALAVDPCAFPHASSVTVSSAAELASALARARPGRLIRLEPGTYPGRFKATVSGTKEDPIIVCGPRAAVLDGGSYASGYVVHLDHVKHWTLSGFTVTRGKEGIMLDTASSVRMIGLLVHRVGQAGIHMRRFSNYNLVAYSEIRDTGRHDPGYGEGVYIGSARSNWSSVTGDSDKPDLCIGNKIVDNAFGPDVRAEAIDVKEGTRDGRIDGNVFDGTGMEGENYADSWMDIKGNGYRIKHNTGHNARRDGFQVHVAVPGWGNNNEFHDNLANVGGSGYGFRIDPDSSGNTVRCDNQVNDAPLGFANVRCTP